MSLGSLAVVERWMAAVNRGDASAVEGLSAETIEIVGPRGSVRGRDVLSGWLARSGFSAEAKRWFCGSDGRVVVEQDARWVDPASGAERGRAMVASHFAVDGAGVARYGRHDHLAEALATAGLAGADEVMRRR